MNPGDILSKLAGGEAFGYVDLFNKLTDELSPEELVRTFLHMLINLQNVERGSFWVREGDQYHCIESVGSASESEKIKGVRIPATRKSIVGWVIENGEMTVARPGEDDRHMGEIESDFDVKSSLILCFPLLLKNGEVYGAVQVIDTTPGAGRINLGQEYLDYLQNLVKTCSIALSNTLAYADQVKKADELEKALADLRKDGFVIGASPAFGQVMTLLENYAATDYPVLVNGESGTGKEFVANRLHKQSPRADKPFLAINCAAIPHTLLESELFGYKKGAFTGANRDKQGMFEAADGGTLFLDEIGEMDIQFQPKLLRVLQDNVVQPLGDTKTRKVDVRIVAATNRDLKQAMEEGTFREDLYYRLNVLPVRIPPLRERTEDVPIFLEHFLGREAARMNMPPKRLTPRAMDALVRYSWPGNVRELENFVKQLIVMAPKSEIGPGDIPPHLLAQDRDGILPRAVEMERAETGAAAEAELGPQHLDMDGRTWSDVEKEYAMYLLEKYRWNVSHAAQVAGVNRSTFNSRLKKLGIRKSDVLGD